MADTDYPAAAYSPDGILWWKLEHHPGSSRPYGDERKIAAYLAFNYSEGDQFTMRDLRGALGSDIIPNDAEHLNRRLRSLRPDGWIIPSTKDDRGLPVGVYRLERKGWHPGSGEDRPRREAISQAARRRVIDRDGGRCVICGVGAGEPYPGEPNTTASLTAGHRIPRDMGGSNEESNLQTECKRCNESVRQELGKPETLEELLPDIRRLRAGELQRLREWLQRGQRTRDRLDEVYDRARRLSAPEREELLATLHKMLGGQQ